MDGGFNTLEKLIYATNIRHKVITSNIANTDTPDYRAKDVDFRSFMDEKTAELKITSPLHLKTASAGSVPGGALLLEKTPSWGDGNNVELDMEIAKMTENGLLYEAGIRLLSSKMKMFRAALRR